ncbi:MAG: methionyl-tRNA formyltransferase, partial [Synergistaceae bacterium]|nr:methionyl-tRNA formyltransferase [Synergistaceae bacterium]
TGGFAARCLESIHKELPFGLVVTSPPSRGGRGMKLMPSPVEKACAGLGIEPRHSHRVGEDSELLALLDEETPLAILVVDFGQKIPEPFLSAPREGCLNIHPSLLPLYRGAAPVQRALMNGDSVTGVSLFRLVEEMDAGPVLLRAEHEPGEEATSGEVMEILAEKGSQLFLFGVKCLIEGTCTFKEQDSESVSFAPKIEKKEAEIFWNQPAIGIANRVRALNPSPGAFFISGKKRGKVWGARRSEERVAPGEIIGFDGGYPVVGAAEGAVILVSVQPEGRQRLDGAEWARGLRLEKGDFLH